ncbi:MAG: hypothetical protein QOK43_3004 [Acidimicrobiaceae bacterium]|nr:hypothetical protein [Acidimicrobiaceae bacterium]
MTLPAEDLPDSITVTVGQGGETGVDGGDSSDGGNTSFGDLILARGGKGGKDANTKMAEMAAVLIDRLTVAALFFADHAQVRDGLLFVSGGGWGLYNVPSNAVIAGAVVFVLDLLPGDKSGVLPLAVELQDPAGLSRWASPFDVEFVSTETAVRMCLVYPFATNADVEGRWSARILLESGTVVATHHIDIRLGD